ncbi:hypothetical protein FPSE_04839 [Fusarium pseudograminearum CS3096]|uniref:Uncharacterized protein n=1 Tax=Fusarium pseudograminearum (strain CS3096) TaxID=1028729 RepID=K3VJQ4_FUSPC|nr:hypothetical protein FPSE_04839 [Fusarium pseudograminearum CS3096]EKJ74947.1 hypothetical protein FPSE_04839 [Fusarium pseudograminearum CS3096]
MHEMGVMTYRKDTAAYQAILGSWAGSIMLRMLIDHEIEIGRGRQIRSVSMVVGENLKYQIGNILPFHQAFSLFIVIGNCKTEIIVYEGG